VYILTCTLVAGDLTEATLTLRGILFFCTVCVFVSVRVCVYTHTRYGYSGDLTDATLTLRDILFFLVCVCVCECMCI
jgi:hypothetical protein